MGLRAERDPGLAQGVPGSEGMVGKGGGRSRGEAAEEREGARGVLGSDSLGGMLRRLMLSAPLRRLEMGPAMGPRLELEFTPELASRPELRLELGPESRPEVGPRTGPDMEGREERPLLSEADPGPDPEPIPMPEPIPDPGLATEAEAKEANERPAAGVDPGADPGAEAALWL